MIKTGLRQRGPDTDGLPGDIVQELGTGDFWESRPRLQRRCRPIHGGTFSDRVERFPRDAVLGTERRHCTPQQSWDATPNDGKTGTRIDRFNAAHPSNIDQEL